MKILMTGWFGAGNLGDEAILISELLLLRNQTKDIEFHILSFGPERTRKLVARIPEVKKVLRMGAKWRVVQSDVAGLLKSFREVDAVFIGGGGLFQDIYNFYPIPFFSFITLLARLCGKPVIFYCLGIGPINTFAGKTLCRWAANAACEISVRDRESADLLKKLGVRRRGTVLADPVFGLEPLSNGEAAKFLRAHGLDRQERIIGVCVQDLLYWSDKSRKALAEALDAAIGRGDTRVAFLPFGGYRDGWFSRSSSDTVDVLASKRLAGLMNQPAAILCADTWTPQELLAAMKRMDLVISMRLHGLIMALTVGTPVIALTYEAESKIFSLMKALGRENAVCEVSQLNTQELHHRIEDALRMGGEARQELRGQIACFQRAVETYTRSLVRALREGIPVDVCLEPDATTPGNSRGKGFGI